MMATFIIEVVFAIYVIARYKLTPVARLAAAILVGLAIFQLAEYNVCETAWGMDSLTWARIGYVAITFLPPLGLHLATRIAGQKQPLFVGLAYAIATAFALFFLFSGQGMTGQQCLGNYVIFSIAPWSAKLYGIYYYGLLAIGVGYSWQVSRYIKSKSKKMALIALAVGYLAFIIPTTAANLIDPSTIAGIPSIMCGFAVILAIILATIVVPRAHQK
jgi:histidine kinase-like protein